MNLSLITHSLSVHTVYYTDTCVCVCVCYSINHQMVQLLCVMHLRFSPVKPLKPLNNKKLHSKVFFKVISQLVFKCIILLCRLKTEASC